MIYKYDSTGKQVGMDVVPCYIADAGDCSLESSWGETMSSFYYDRNNNRAAMICKEDDGVYYFVYDPTASVPAVVYEQGPTHRYFNIREPDGSLVSRETYNAGGNLIASRTYHYDGLGSTVALTDENGQVTDKYSYDEWGNVTPDSGNVTTDNPYQYVGRYGYYTHYQEPDFKLLQLGVRYYDPEIGRFTSRDPIKDGMNWYAYVEGNPMEAIDPSGRESLGDIIRNPGSPHNWQSRICLCDESMAAYNCLSNWLSEIDLAPDPYSDDPFEQLCCATAPVGGGIIFGFGNLTSCAWVGACGKAKWCVSSSGWMFCSGSSRIGRAPGLFNGRMPLVGKYIRLGYYWDPKWGCLRFGLHGGPPRTPKSWHR